ncbi:DUF1254 domain-containing protein [Bradyrhizobium elkanii]|uniref:DUF1254 domain-containing protein n=1 Tax=Bradyrhizobium elkanii TaxID=29448 RepID=UPI001BA59084|nr:DUF1254 domain-containing protein [Bradyrhizobium elkanii]MBR1162646.1 DUF1254 domain-containing protein [Bradyrhizobium elkanii]
MKRFDRTALLTCVGLASAVVASPTLAQMERYDALANAPMAENRPAPETAKLLKDELLFQRATQAYLWAMPLLNTLGMKNGSEKVFGSGYNILPVWKKRLDAKTLVTTPNSDVIYAMSYLDVGKDGPLVFEAAPGLQGILLDMWQRPIPGPSQNFLGDVGFFGPDKGKGGKYLILPPGYDKPVPDGYFVYRSATNNVFVFLRSFYQEPSDLTPAVKVMEATKIYPLGGEASARSMQFPDASGVSANMLPPGDGGAFDQLKQLVDSEVPSLASADGLGMLASIGIVKGQPFDPDANTRAILDRAAKTAYKTSRVIGREENAGGRSLRVYPDRRWLNPFADGTPLNPSGALDLAWMNVASGYTDLNARIWMFTDYYSISPGMVSQTPGMGAKYMIAFTDGAGVPLSGGTSYRVKLPPNVPAANFWSVTLYEAANASGLANGQPFPSLGSRDKPVQNADGSTDLYLGPTAPQGQERNWLRTVPGNGYFVILRLYGPTEAAINKSWKPDDIVKTN